MVDCPSIGDKELEGQSRELMGWVWGGDDCKSCWSSFIHNPTQPTLQVPQNGGVTV